MPIIKVTRKEKSDYQCIGECSVFIDNVEIFTSKTIERGDNDNRARISCIPNGFYDIVLEWSDRFKENLWEIKGVKNRSECKFHAANYSRQLNGCIALGEEVKDIDGDGNKDVTNSKRTMALFHLALNGHNKATLIVEDGKI
jgi:hypothetical protein